MQHRCVGCGEESPVADTFLALVGELGWRASWEHGTVADPNARWRCPECWAAFKEEALVAREDSGEVASER